ncbi:MAG: hypothetical protein R3219_06895 [Hydrogenovibrio sp.]|nr:hypothetical protein [Hydrogenovibrio sp.]
MLDQAKTLKMIRTEKVKKQKGASMIEYALVVAAVVALGVTFFGNGTTTLGTFGQAISDKLTAVSNNL